MSYLALARKWRPRTFAELLGQTPVVTVLTRSLNQQRLHHAYLFTGTRGVGKTSIARLFAKALNCEAGINSEPCLQCATCLSIEQGNFVDLIEIDGASKTKVEDTRDLLDSVNYAPTTGRFKIYLIDEVHMLSNHSFNALLKTLEEPPEHVKFLLATTDPHKLPLTVLSRCLQLNLKPIDSSIIEQHLITILQQETLEYDTDVPNLLAIAAKGSLRDALSLLDQIIVASDQHIYTAIVKQHLGMTAQDYALLLLEAVATSNPQSLVSITQQITREGGMFHYVLETLLAHLHTISLVQMLPPKSYPACAQLLSLSQIWSPEETQLFYQIGLRALQDLDLAPTLAMGFEMALLRMYAFREVPPVNVLHPPHDIVVELQDTATIEPPSANIIWAEVVDKLNLTGLAATAIEHADFVEKTKDNIVLCIDKAHQSLYTKAVQTRIETALSTYYKHQLTLTIKHTDVAFTSLATHKAEQKQNQQQDMLQSIQTDPYYQQIQQTFSSEIIKNSVELLKNDI